MKKVLLTGGLGYIGSEMAKDLAEKNFDVVVLDSCYFEKCSLDDWSSVQVLRADIRNVSNQNIRDIDYVIHLAALSNDPLGELNPKLTYEINRDASIKLAKMAKASGVQKFIFVSTQSIYGISNSKKPLNEDDVKAPATAYAKAKWEAEQEILQMNSRNFCAIAVRPSTVFGWGSRIRNDIIFNNMIMMGLKVGEIQVHTDGTPYRPVIYVLDLVKAITSLLVSDSRDLGGEAFNVGLWDGNYSVKEIAEHASICLGELPIKYQTEDIKDSRSYIVNFQKIYNFIGFKAETGLHEGGSEIAKKFNMLNSDQKRRFFDETTRLNTLKLLKESGLVKSDLSWA